MKRGGRGGEPRKLLQLAAQIRRSLETTLVGECADEILQNISVEKVEPAAGNLMNVTLMVHPPGASLPKEDVMRLVEANRSLLMHRVAEDVHRRGVPELSFWLVREPGAAGPLVDPTAV